MIISRGRNYIFVHVPKTGGTSLALALEDRAMKDDIMLGDTPKALNRRNRLKDLQAAGRLWKHATLADIEGVVTREEIAQMFTFTLVRNPFDRIVSYYHWLRERHFDHPAVSLAKQSSFEGFLTTPLIQTSLRDAPYPSFMRDSGGQEHCSSYIRLEHFDQDAAPLFDHLGFTLTLTRENASVRNADYQSYYTPKLRHIVESICAQDIARFEYQFARPS